MNQDHQTTQDMKAGTLASSEKTPAIKRRGRPPKETVETCPVVKQDTVPAEVLTDLNQLDRTVTAAKNSGKRFVLVTNEILKDVLKHNYKNDPYMIYQNMELHDYTRFDETVKKSKMTREEAIYGRK